MVLRVLTYVSGYQYENQVSFLTLTKLRPHIFDIHGLSPFCKMMDNIEKSVIHTIR